MRNGLFLVFLVSFLSFGQDQLVIDPEGSVFGAPITKGMHYYEDASAELTTIDFLEKKSSLKEEIKILNEEVKILGKEFENLNSKCLKIQSKILEITDSASNEEILINMRRRIEELKLEIKEKDLRIGVLSSVMFDKHKNKNKNKNSFIDENEYINESDVFIMNENQMEELI